MKILLNNEERCTELEELISKLDDIKQECISEDILEDIDNLLIKYTPEYERLDEELQQEYKQELKQQNLEYEKSVWAS